MCCECVALLRCRLRCASWSELGSLLAALVIFIQCHALCVCIASITATMEPNCYFERVFLLSFFVSLLATADAVE